jgi:hypothetical protein
LSGETQMTLALEINDVGLLLVRDGVIIAEEPGCAMLDGPEVETGAKALRRARLKPLYAETRHWQELGTAPLPRPMPAAASYAEVAWAQLVALMAAIPESERDALLAVPEWYTREQLAVLLGVASEAGLRVAGLVGAGLAAAALEPVPASLLQLELAMHQSVITVLDHTGELRRSGCELLPRHGWLALQKAWIDRIAAEFVRRTRYDPLHEAASEQRLLDGLPGWLATLEHEPVLAIEAEAAGSTLSVELTREDFIAAAAATYDSVAHALQRARPAPGPLSLRVSHRWAMLPGFLERLEALRDCEVSPLPRGAAALGALACERALRRDPTALVLVQRLPVPLLAAAAATAVANPNVPDDERPTHAVYRSRAHEIRAVPLVIGVSIPDGQRALAVPAGPGISRVHCALWRDGDGVWLEDRSTYGTYLNGVRIGGRVALALGDRLRIGSPGVELELVRAVDDDGAT